MKRIRLTVAYDGTEYCGWQIQPNGVTVEGELNAALSRITGKEIKVIGASRTDAGVHSRGNVAVFDTETRIPPDRIAYAVNRELPEDIVVTESVEVPETWHPRYQKSAKTYEYRILNREMPDPMRRRDTWHVPWKLDMEAMRRGAGYLIGEHDFKSFCSIRTGVKDTVRTVYSLEIRKEDDIVVIRITGNGFLYNMVRIISGTLLEAGKGRIKPEEIKDILEALNREKAGPTAPPMGLVLDRIAYESGQAVLLDI